MLLAVYIFLVDLLYIFIISYAHSFALFAATFVISGMKVYVTDEKELIMEPSIKWAGNPNVTISVKAFGLKATVQVIHLFYEEGYL